MQNVATSEKNHKHHDLLKTNDIYNTNSAKTNILSYLKEGTFSIEHWHVNIKMC